MKKHVGMNSKSRFQNRNRDKYVSTLEAYDMFLMLQISVGDNLFLRENILIFAA